MTIFLVMKEAANDYDSEEIVKTFLDEERALEFLTDKDTEEHKTKDTDDYKRYSILRQAEEDRPLTKDESTDLKQLETKFYNFNEHNWWITEMEIEDSTQFFREKKLDYLMK